MINPPSYLFLSELGIKVGGVGRAGQEGLELRLDPALFHRVPVQRAEVVVAGDLGLGPRVAAKPSAGVPHLGYRLQTLQLGVKTASICLLDFLSSKYC